MRDRLARYYNHLSTLILTCYDTLDPIFSSAEPPGAAVGGLPYCLFAFLNLSAPF